MCQNCDWVITRFAMVTRNYLRQGGNRARADGREASSAAHYAFLARRGDRQACEAGYCGMCNRSEDTKAVFCVDRMIAAGQNGAEFGLQSGRVVTGPLEQCGKGVCADLADRFRGFGWRRGRVVVPGPCSVQPLGEGITVVAGFAFTPHESHRQRCPNQSGGDDKVLCSRSHAGNLT